MLLQLKVIAALSVAGLVFYLTAAAPPSSRSMNLREGGLYGVTISAPDLAAIRGEHAVSIGDAKGIVARKRIHAYDPDFYFTLRARAAGPVAIDAPDNFRVTITELPQGPVSEQRADWRQAQPIRLGDTIAGAADDRPYIPARNDPEELTAGQQWFRFTATEPALAFFAIEAVNRDVPADVEVFHATGDGGIEPYAEGSHRYVPEATQNFPGLANYRTRRVNPGETYYLRVSANHPAFRLRTAAYPLPPYKDPRQAVRTAMDFAVSLGDSWLNNIPRRGSVATRDTLQHPETQNCIACHPTQFTTRAYLAAVANGYAPVNRTAAENLIWQLRSNPRPLPGHPGVNWSRMIFSARTVSSRLPVLLDAASRLDFGPAPRDLVTGAAGYLKLHHKGLDALAADEADGASPAVSPLEIALQTWQTYGFAGEDRSALERQIRAYEPRNVIDLNWKIIALAKIDPRADLKPWIDRLFQFQRADLRFPYEFDRTAPAADFITYHALYALAEAGIEPGDPRIAPLVSLTLAQQLPSGGWQGDPGPKAFHTPFRETQFAIMALSKLFPETRTPVVPVAAPGLLQTVLGRVEHAKTDPWPLLGDESKLVRIAAGESIRHELSLHPDRTARLKNALTSSDSRMRSGALHVFTKQFRDIAVSSPDLRESIRGLLADPAPLIRLQAVQALSRWHSWDSDDSILDAFASRLHLETETRIRRALTEAVSGALDENIGYAEAWMRTMSDPADRQRTVDAMHERSRAQAQILARNLAQGGRPAKLALLTALWDLPLRHMAIPEENRGRAEVVLPAYYAEYSNGVADLASYPPYREALSFQYGARNGFHKTRIGNDSDLIDLSGAGSELERQLIALIEGSDLELQVAAIKAGSALGGSMTRAYTSAVMQVLMTGNGEARQAARYVFEGSARGRLTLGDADQHDEAFVQLLARALDPKYPDSLSVMLPLVADLPAGSQMSRNPVLMGRIDNLLFERPVHPKALQAASSFPRVADGPLMRSIMLRAFEDLDNRPLRAAAAETAVRAYLADPTMPELARQFSAASKGEVRRMMLDLLDPQRFSLRLSALSLYNPPPAVSIPPDANLFSSAKVQEFVAESLRDADPDVRAAAQDLAAQFPELRRSSIVEQALRETGNPDRKLDFAFFAEKVQPILARPGADGKACVVCHASHGIFPLRLPASKGTFTEQQSRENFRFAARVVDLNSPQKSLLLVKPTRPNDSAGDPNLYLATHNGGERWPGNENSAEYQTILRWIRGAAK